MFDLKNSVVFMAMLATVLGAFAGQSLSVLAGCPGEVYYRYNNAQDLSTPVGWTFFQDMDNDGRKDLIGINKSTATSPTPASLVFYKRTSGGYVTAPVISSLGSSFTTFALTVGDINGDGNLDILNKDTNAAPYTVTAYYGDGSGGFTPGATFTNGYSGTFSIGDLNGDGKGDLVSSSSSGVGYHLVQPDGTFGPYVSLTTHPPDIARLADFNADGKLDVLVWSYPAGTIMINQGSGNFTAGATTNVFYSQKPDFIADVNGDGRPDIVTNAHVGVPSGSNYSFSVYLTQPGAASFATTVYTPGFSYRPNFAAPRTEVADVDGDGDLDVLFIAPNVYFITRNNGAGAMSPEVTIPTGSTPGLYDDALGDTGADIVSLNRAGVFKELSDTVKFSQSVCSRPGRTDYVDFDGDAVTDVGFFRPADGYWSYRNSRDGGTITNLSGFGTHGDIPVSQDYNGDGRSDRSYFRPSTGGWTIKDAVTGSVSNVGWGLNGDKPAPSDYDGDGKADVAIYRPSDGTWWILYSSNGSYGVQSFGISEDIPVPMDYDGDRISDIAVFRPSTGVWYIQKSTGGYFIDAFGISTDKPVPADYDNDGSADIAVYRNGYWYAMRIKDWSVLIRQYGATGNIPIPINRVSGNPGANLAVFNNSSGFLFELNGLSQQLYEMSGQKTISTILPSN